MQQWHKMYIEFITEHEGDLKEILDFIRENEREYPQIDFKNKQIGIIRNMLASAKFYDFSNEILLDNLDSKAEKIFRQCEKDILGKNN